MPTKIEQLAQLTKNLGGMFKEFNQSYAQIKSARVVQGLFTSDKGNLDSNNTELYVGGMCHTMSMYWVVGQSGGISGKKTFLEWVMPSGDKNSVNMGAVSVLVTKTVMYKAKGSKAQSMGIGKDAHFDDSFFLLNGIKSKNEHRTGFDGIKREIGRKRDRLFMISYGSGTGGHACAAQSTSEGGYSYFDPNYGQVILIKRDAWDEWYDQYLVISGYSTKYNRQSVEGYKAIRHS